MLKWLNSQLKVIKFSLKYNPMFCPRVMIPFVKSPQVSATPANSLISSFHLLQPPSSTTSVILKTSGSEQPGSNDTWQGGKTSGNIQLNGSTYYIRIQSKTIETIKISDYGTQKKAFTYAKKVLYEHCKEKNLLRNTYKISHDDRGSYLEVKTGDTVFKCDYGYLELVEKYVWKYNKREKLIYTNIYSETSKQTLYFHRAIFDLISGFRVEHADGDKLNNRKYNLILKHLS